MLPGEALAGGAGKRGGARYLVGGAGYPELASSCSLRGRERVASKGTAEEDKQRDLWAALPGFGGTALLYPYLVSEGLKRGLSLARIAELASANPARAFGLYPKKGALAVGADADLVVLDPEREQVVTPALLQSAQDFTPFAGLRVRGWPTHTVLRGEVVFENGKVRGRPAGRYLPRPAG